MDSTAGLVACIGHRITNYLAKGNFPKAPVMKRYSCERTVDADCRV